MLVFILSIFSLLGISQTFLFSKPDVCISENVSLNCLCKDRENITISQILNFDTKHVVLEGCGLVIVPLGAVAHLQLDSISFSDIDRLDILPYAFVGVREIKDIRIENIREFIVRQHGFVGLYNVSNAIIRNVTSKTLPVGSFSGVSNIQNFLIENSSFDEIQETTFVMTNVTNFTISGCKLRSLENTSFLLHNVESITFEKCDIGKTKNNTFSMAFVERLSFVNCQFEIAATTFILSKSLETFAFNHCTVEILETDAFALVDASKSIQFTHNVIKLAEEYSLIPSTGTFNSKNVEIDDCCNSFTCDCNIYWLWEPGEDESYDSLLKNSLCIGKPETNLSSLEPVLDSFKNCMTLEMRIFHPKQKTSITSQEPTFPTVNNLNNGQMNLFEQRNTVSKTSFLCMLLCMFFM